jgi:hypothetical protein
VSEGATSPIDGASETVNIIQRFLAWIRSLFVHTISGSQVGIVVHEGTAADLAQLVALGHPLVRTTNYGDPDSASRILAFLNAGHSVISIVPFGRGYGPVGAGMVLQLDNEPDAQTPAVSPEHYGQTFRSTMQAMRQSLPSSIPIVTAGFSNNASVDWMTRALLSGASDADAVCFHAYGDDLVLAFQNRIAAVRVAMTAARCTKPLWLTEIGFSSVDPVKQAAQLKALLILPALRDCARVYVYALATDELTDFEGICKHDLSRTPLPAFAVVQAAMARS